MATVSFYQPADMFSPYIWYGVVIQATKSFISLTDGYRFGNYQGSFTYKSGGLSGGTLTGYSQYINNVIDYNVSGVKISAVTAKRYIDAGDAAGLQMVGLAGNDTLNGSSFADNIVGYAGKDVIYGNAGNDIISGGLGTDTIYTGTGSDIVVLGYFGKSEVASTDVIADFSKESDLIALHTNGFAALPVGQLNSANFVLGKKALDANDYIIVDGANVFYDADGSGSGKAVLIAKVTLTGGGALSASDFLVTSISP